MKKAIVMVAGKSTRTYPLTATKPKALLSVANKPLLSYLLDGLAECVEEVILVVGYKKEMIEKMYGKKYKDLILTYVEQHEIKGTGHAVQQAESLMSSMPENESFMIIGGDDFFDITDIKKMSEYSWGILGQEIENPESYGVLSVNKSSHLVGIEEKPKKPASKYVNTGCYVVKKEIFSMLKKVKKSKRGEYELVDAIVACAKKHPLTVLQTKKWQPITYPWDLLELNKKILEKISFKNQGTIEPGVTIHGSVAIGKGTVLRSGVYIEGPVCIGNNCTIGPNCYIRPYTSIGDHSKIGNAVEIKNCIIGNNTHMGHLSYVGDSVFGEHVNCGAGTIVANLRHDNNSIKSEVNGELVDSKRRKLGTIVGDGVHTGIHTSIYPGRKLWPGVGTLPGEVIQKDKKSDE